MRNLGIVLVLLAVVRLWTESKIKVATSATPVNPTLVKLDMAIIGSNVATTYALLAAGLLLIFGHRQISKAL